jgi:CheY-like chemotaxis protein
MPECDGLTATRVIRGLNIVVPIVALTGHALQEEIQPLLDAGVNAVLTKPTSRTQLITVLHRFLPP